MVRGPDVHLCGAGRETVRGRSCSRRRCSRTTPRRSASRPAALDALGGVPVYDCVAQLGSACGELPLTAAFLDPASLVLINGVTVTSG